MLISLSMLFYVISMQQGRMNQGNLVRIIPYTRDAFNPFVLKHLLGQRESISVFGTDYPMFDGTCIRDYIHVTDLAGAHILALDTLLESHDTHICETYNLGNGQGYLVREIIKKCEQVTGKTANITYTERRPGDPAILVASAQKIKKALGWKMVYTLEDIIRTVWYWHKKNT
jgi:UDP-glucose 4-epimerase